MTNLTKKRGPAKGQGGAPKGPAKVTISVRVLAATPSLMKAQGLKAGAILDQVACQINDPMPSGFS